MRPSIKAFLLSAFVFPGLGQLYNQDRKKGVLLVLLANLLFGVLFLLGMILMSQEYHAVFYPRPLTPEMLKQMALDVLTRPLFLLPFTLLVGLWAYGVVDAIRNAPARPPGS